MSVCCALGQPLPSSPGGQRDGWEPCRGINSGSSFWGISFSFCVFGSFVLLNNVPGSLVSSPLQMSVSPAQGSSSPACCGGEICCSWKVPVLNIAVRQSWLVLFISTPSQEVTFLGKESFLCLHTSSDNQVISRGHGCVCKPSQGK